MTHDDAGGKELVPMPPQPHRQPKLNRKSRRLMAAIVKQYKRKELRRLYRDLRAMRVEDGKVPWRPTKEERE